MNRKLIVYHLFFWLSYTFCCISISKIQAPRLFFIEDQIGKYFLAICIFYFTIFFLKTTQKNIFILIISYLLIPLAWYYGMKYALYYYLFPYFTHFPKVKFTWDQFILSGAWWIFHFSLYGYFYWLYFKTIKDKKDIYELKTSNLQLQANTLQLENEKLILENKKNEIEYNFLKAQINPHFLYNALNYFYNKTLLYSELTAAGIAKLADLMRYSLKVHNVNGKATLKEEIRNIYNYISLQQMRFSDEIQIKFKIYGNISTSYILPHILITLVENTFKHGEIDNAEFPVQMCLEVVSNKIYFSSSNKIRMGPKDDLNTGVGLKNVSDRLKMEYGANHSLNFSSDGTFFYIKLYIEEINLEKAKQPC